MKILFFGDVFGRAGRTAVAEKLPIWRDEHKPDLIIANPENSAGGVGANAKVLDELLEAGVEAFTFGDHAKDTDFSKLTDYPIVRPANLTKVIPGVGSRIIETALHQRILLISLLGNAFFKLPSTHYFEAADELLNRHAVDKPDAIFVDFHAEATSEKGGLANYLDGRVTAIIGTHTHVPTADTRLLPKGTAFQSDVGMCGAFNSIIGMQTDEATSWLRRELGEEASRPPGRPEVDRPYICDAILIETAGATAAKSIRRLTTRP